jgi:hypothetical protein
MKALIIALAFIITASGLADARYRSPTYIDDHGVRRIQKTGKIYRDYAAVREFKRMHPMPNDGRAYDIDHIKPLKAGGADKPYNMQWVTVEQHRRKTALE